MIIDPTFSVYDSIEKNEPSNIFLTTVVHLKLFSRIIEREISHNGLFSPLYVGVQQFTNLMPILHRYQRMSKFHQPVYLFGIADITIPVSDSLHFIPLETDSPLALEWFILINQPNYAKLLSACEIIPSDGRAGERTFKAVMTNERETVKKAIEALSEHCNFNNFQ